MDPRGMPTGNRVTRGRSGIVIGGFTYVYGLCQGPYSVSSLELVVFALQHSVISVGGLPTLVWDYRDSCQGANTALLSSTSVWKGTCVKRSGVWGLGDESQANGLRFIVLI